MPLRQQLEINSQAGISQKRLYLYTSNKVYEHLVCTNNIIVGRLTELGCGLSNCNWVLTPEQHLNLLTEDIDNLEGFRYG